MIRTWCVAALALLAAPVVLNAQLPLAPGELRTATIKPGEQQTVVVEIGADQSARLEVDTTLALTVTLGRPDGSTSVLIDVGDEERTPTPLTIVAAQGGSHSLDVRLREDAGAGTYTLRFHERRAATERDRKQAQGEAHLREGIRLFQLGARESRLAATEQYRQAETIFTEIDNQPMLAKSVDLTAAVYDDIGEARLVIPAFERAAALYRALENVDREAVMLKFLGNQLAYQGRAADAIEPLQKAAARFHDNGSLRLEGDTLLILGSAYYAIGQVDNAIASYERGLPIVKSVKDEAGEASAYSSLAVLALSQGHHQSILSNFAHALELYRKLGQQQMVARVLGNIGAAHLRFGDAESGLDYLLRAHEASKLEPDPQYDPAILGNTAVAYMMLDQPQKALGFADAQLRGWHDSGNRVMEGAALLRVASVHERIGDLDAAKATYESSLAVSRETRNGQGEGYALNGLARVRLRQGAFADARTVAAEALAIGRSAHLRPVEEVALVTLARSELGSEMLDAARAHATEAVALTESIRSTIAGPDQRSGFVRQNYAAYDVLVDVLMRLHRLRPGEGFERQAFDVSERARARTMLDLITESRSNIRDSADASLLSREQALRAQLAGRRNDSDERVQALIAQFRELQNEIRAANPRYASLVEPPVADLAGIQQSLLDRDTVLVEYFLGTERSYAWVVDAEAATSHELPSRAQIDALARRAHEAISRPQSSDLRSLQELSDAIIKPLGTRIAGKRLAIVSEGSLQYIPFAALPGSDGRLLIASHEIVSLPSASTLRALRDVAPSRPAATRSVFVAGDPVFDSADPRVKRSNPRSNTTTATALERSARDSGLANLERLLFTRREADAIASLVPAGNARKLLDFDANLERITGDDLADYRVVHFATHGLLNNKHPELSGLVFSLVDPQGQPRNGFLPAYEIYNLELNADLVVLSACQTALGEEVRGEGLVGLTRAFMYAGTSRVVASLWRVPDSATAALMQRFYRELLVEHRRPADALRIAQQSVRAERRWAAPYFWAGFTLAGEWR